MGDMALFFRSRIVVLEPYIEVCYDLYAIDL